MHITQRLVFGFNPIHSAWPAVVIQPTLSTAKATCNCETGRPSTTDRVFREAPSERPLRKGLEGSDGTPQGGRSVRTVFETTSFAVKKPAVSNPRRWTPHHRPASRWAWCFSAEISDPKAPRILHPKNPGSGRRQECGAAPR